MNQTETKIEATHRLQREGRWEEASVYREKVRLENREKGMTRKDANEASWTVMIAQFPPATDRIEMSNSALAIERLIVNPATGDLELSNAAPASDPYPDICDDDTLGLPRDPIREAFWVLGKHRDIGVCPSECPNSHTWRLLMSARQDFRAFANDQFTKAVNSLHARLAFEDAWAACDYSKDTAKRRRARSRAT